jgi:hypothetical protein
MTKQAMVPAIQTYCEVIEEIKGRYAARGAACAGQFADKTPDPCALEFCYLQLRLICELIALGCLVAHRDIVELKESKKIAKAWHSAVILAEIQKLHPQFYPKPSRQILNESGQVEKVAPIEQGFLTREGFIKLHGECGGVLHRGSIKSLLSREPGRYSFRTVAETCGRIITLLNHHQIQMTDPDLQYWIVMQGADGRIIGTKCSS